MEVSLIKHLANKVIAVLKSIPRLYLSADNTLDIIKSRYYRKAFKLIILGA